MTSSIPKFYAGRSLFITGGAGFIGKQVVEKIIRSCPAVDQIYILMRPKKNKTTKDRLEEMTSSPVFSRLNREQPDFRKKLTLVSGDILQPGLGINDADHSRLTSSVTLVLHTAATLSFVEPMQDAVNSTILGTRRVIQLIKTFKSIDAFLYLSTAYSNVDKHVIEEKVYDPPMEAEKLIALTETLNSEQLAMITPSLIGKRPNTYTYTKAIAEKLIEDEIGDIPSVIIRPSAVIAAVNEPFPGWVDTHTSSNAIFCGVGLGMLRYHNILNGKILLVDLIPVDITANYIVAAAWQLGTQGIRSNHAGSVPVINLTTGDVCPVTVEQLATYMSDSSRKYPLSMAIRKPKFVCTVDLDKTWLFRQFEYYIHLPLYCWTADTLARITGKKPRAVKTMNLYRNLREVMGYFASNDWIWHTDNLKRLVDSLSPSDRKEFNLDRHVNWKEHFVCYWLGIRTFMFKQTPVPKETLDEASSSFRTALQSVALPGIEAKNKFELPSKLQESRQMSKTV